MNQIVTALFVFLLFASSALAGEKQSGTNELKDDKDRIFRLIEKPRRPINEYQGTGHCIFNNAILDYIDITPIHHDRGEKELPDLIQSCIDDGKTVKAFHVCSQYFNINSKEDLLSAGHYT